MAVTNYGDYDSWQRHALITVDDGTTAVNMQALTETIDIDTGEREYDKIDLVNLGQIAKHGAIGITTVTFEGYMLQAGTDGAGTATGFWDLFADKPDMDSADPLTNTITNTVTRYRVAILWTNDGAATAGTTAVTSGTTYAGTRFMLADCTAVSCKDSFTDGVLKSTLVFKGTTMDSSAAGNVKWESVALATESALDAPSAYVAGTTKW